LNEVVEAAGTDPLKVRHCAGADPQDEPDAWSPWLSPRHLLSEFYEMQARSIFGAAVQVFKDTGEPVIP
jgi:pyruvate,orthophosphate dikinase